METETEEEFIERTLKNKQENENKKDKHIEIYEPLRLRADNSDNTKYIVFKEDEDDITITLNIEGKVYKKSNIEVHLYMNTECIALSPSGSILALFCRRKVHSHRGETVCIEPFLEIQKIDLKENEDGEVAFSLGKKRELLPLSLKPTSIDFNKQGTHLIAHGKAYSVTQEATHTIFPLKIVDPNTPQMKATNKLQEYLRNKCVCNQYIKGK